MSRKLFGTDGIRGQANRDPMTAETAMKLGRALTYILREQTEEPRIVIGKDTRRSSYMLENALVAGVCSMGGYALELGPLPTPAVAYIIRGMRAHGGVMISASHNPFHDNGLKVFGPEGFKLNDDLEARVEELMLDGDALESGLSEPTKIGRVYHIEDALGRYLTNLKSIFWRDFDLSGLKIVFDGANGAGYKCGPRLFEELGAEVVRIACEPNGFNINQDCAQQDPQILAKAVLENQADIGLAVDGDADRLIVADEKGQVVSGEHALYALACFLKESGRLNANTLVTTSMANQALVAGLKEQGIRVVRTQVGDRYVTKYMRENDLMLGGETSGHFLFMDQNTTADGLFSALEVLAILKAKEWKASKLQEGFSLLPQKLVSIPVKEKRPLETVPAIQNAIDSVQGRYGDQGRVNVRYSGTELLLRLMVEGPDQGQVDKDVNELSSIIQKELA